MSRANNERGLISQVSPVSHSVIRRPFAILKLNDLFMIEMARRVCTAVCLFSKTYERAAVDSTLLCCLSESVSHNTI